MLVPLRGESLSPRGIAQMRQRMHWKEFLLSAAVVLAAAFLPPGGEFAALSAEETQPADKQQVIAGRTLDEWAADLSAEGRFARLRAVKMLGLFGRPSVPALTKSLSRPDAAVRYLAASELGNIGKPAAPAVPTLRRLLEDEHQAVRISVAFALCRLGHVDGALPHLVAGLKDPQRATACSAADFLARIGPPARSAVAALREAAQHNDYHVQHAAEEALRCIQAKSDTGKQQRSD